MTVPYDRESGCQLGGGCIYDEAANACPLCDEDGADIIARRHSTVSMRPLSEYRIGEGDKIEPADLAGGPRYVSRQMTFPEALTEIFAGKLVTREAWHGEIFVYLEKPEEMAIGPSHPLAGVYPDNTKLAHHAYVAMKSHGVVMPWTPGQPDMFADDWYVVAV